MTWVWSLHYKQRKSARKTFPRDRREICPETPEGVRSGEARRVLLRPGARQKPLIKRRDRSGNGLVAMGEPGARATVEGGPPRWRLGFAGAARLANPERERRGDHLKPPRWRLGFAWPRERRTPAACGRGSFLPFTLASIDHGEDVVLGHDQVL